MPGSDINTGSVDEHSEAPAGLYDDEYFRLRESIKDFQIEVKLLLKLLELKPGLSVLEIGCGSGVLLSILEERRCKPAGIDLSEDALKIARSRTRCSELFRADATLLPFEDSKFDRIVANHLVEHLQDLTGALKEWRRVMKPGALLAICTPNRLYPDKAIFDDPGHIRYYDTHELKKILESEGFTVIQSFTVFPHLGARALSVKIGVPFHRVFKCMPYFRQRGRSVLVSAVLTGK